MRPNRSGVATCATILALLTGPLAALAQPPTSKPQRGRTARPVSGRVYRSRCGFEIRYPQRFRVSAEGPDVNELRPRAGETIGGTQEPLLDQIIVREDATEILRFEVAHYPLVDTDWNWRACGQDGFMEIASAVRTRLAGYKAVHVVSVFEAEDHVKQRVHFVCVNGPRSLIMRFDDELRTLAERIVGTLRFVK